MAERETLAARRERMWQAVEASQTAVPALIRLILREDVTKLPAHPVLWSRCRSLVLTEELTEWAWLHWFSATVWPEEKSADRESSFLRDRLITPERQLVIDASTSLLAPNANASGSVVPFTTVASAEVRSVLGLSLRTRADAHRGLTTLPIPARLKRILNEGAIINRVGGTEEEIWKARPDRATAPGDVLAGTLLDLLVDTGCTDTYTLLPTHAKRAEFVAKLALAIPADAPRLTFTD